MIMLSSYQWIRTTVVAVNMFSWKVVAVLSVEIWAIFVCRGEASLSHWCS